jgi:hypothetical protein
VARERAEDARVRAAERTRPGLRFGYALSLFAELAPLRAGHVVAGGDATWSASLAALRRLSDDVVPDRDVLDGREVLVDTAMRAEELERRLVGLQEQAKARAKAAGAREASTADARDACRAELLVALRAAVGLGVNKWAKEAADRTARLERSLEGSLPRGGSEVVAVDFATARAALDVALEEAASWESRHDPRAWTARSENTRQALLAAQGGIEALTDPARLASLLPHIEALCSALTDEKRRLETDDPSCDIPRASADSALQRACGATSRLPRMQSLS